MALQVWLSLNDNVKNQGLDGNATVSGTPVYYAGGKIGKGLNLQQSLNFHSPKMEKAERFSIAFWIYAYEDATSTDMWNKALQFATYRPDGTAGSQFRFESCYGSSVRALSFHNNDAPSITQYSAILVQNKEEWHHVCVTCDKEYLRSYVDGKLVSTVYALGGSLSGYGSIGSSTYKGCMNDLRIYDHVLSALEVKELSKGLMLHYKLSGIGGENLVKGTGIEYTNNDYLTRTYVPVTPLTAGEIYTVTLCVTPAQNVEYYGLYFSGGYASPASLPVKGTSRQVIKKTFTMGYYSGRTPTDDISHANAHFYRFPNDGTVTTNSTIHWVKIEKGNKATPWCPNPADALYSTLGFDDGVEYDCSGYGHNGDVIGTMTWSNDTRRYTGSYLCEDDSTYIKSPTLSTSGCADSYTISYWSKIDGMGDRMAFGFSDGNRLNLYPSNGFCWNTGDGSSNQFLTSSGGTINYSVYNSAWHHYVITGDGTTTTLYIDGEEVGTATVYKPITGSTIVISGWDTGTSYKWLNGNLSDFRLYATCLSASDVKSLYNVSASVGDNGAFFAHEIVEE